MSDKILYVSDIASLFGVAPRKGSDHRELIKKIKELERARNVQILHREGHRCHYWTTLGILKKYVPELFSADIEPEELDQQVLLLKRRVLELESRLARLEGKNPKNLFNAA